jgi:hypothetical protein
MKLIKLKLIINAANTAYWLTKSQNSSKKWGFNPEGSDRFATSCSEAPGVRKKRRRK